MAREVNNEQPFQDKVVKLIPTEIVGAYLVIMGIIAPASAAAPAPEVTILAVAKLFPANSKPFNTAAVTMIAVTGVNLS